MPKKSNFKFVKEKNKTYFQDEWGDLWSAEQLGGLFRALKKHREASDEMEYYYLSVCGRQDVLDALEAKYEMDKEKEDLEKRQQIAIKKNLCKKCGGIIIKDIGTSYLAKSHGKTCSCKK